MSTIVTTVVPYDTDQIAGMSFIALAGWASLLAIFYLLTFRRPDHTIFGNTRMFGYFMSLLAANVLQAFGTVMNFWWVAKFQVESGPYCTAQGAIKHVGGLATSIWTFIIACHVFNLLFLRVQTDRESFIGVVIAVWLFVLLLILIGVFIIQKPANGPFYGIAGSWCWITSNYNDARIFLEYFFFFFVAFSCLILYTAVLLRVRGNLIKDDKNRWRLRIESRDKELKLSLLRDPIDNAMLRVVRMMVWYPVVYTIIILPMGITRLYEFSGAPVPFWATATTAVILNLNGFVDVFLLVFLERHFPDTSQLPMSAKREYFRSSKATSGIVPYTPTQSERREDSEYWLQRTPTRMQPARLASEPSSVPQLQQSSS